MEHQLNEGLLKHRISIGLKALDKQSSEEAQHVMGWRLMRFVREFRERKKITNMREISPEYSRRKNAGFSAWASVAFAVVCAVVLALAISHQMRQTYYYHYPESYLRIVRNLDPCLPDGSCGFRFDVQNVQADAAGRVIEVGEVTEMHFCPEPEPRFEAGHTLRFIRLKRIGGCYAIDGFDTLKGADGFPTLPVNCKPDYSVAKVAGHIACEGGAARFYKEESHANSSLNGVAAQHERKR